MWYSWLFLTATIKMSLKREGNVPTASQTLTEEWQHENLVLLCSLLVTSPWRLGWPWVSSLHKKHEFPPQTYLLSWLPRSGNIKSLNNPSCFPLYAQIWKTRYEQINCLLSCTLVEDTALNSSTVKEERASFAILSVQNNIHFTKNDGRTSNIQMSGGDN